MNTAEMDRDNLILGALLHDIGKFRQRTDIPLTDADKSIEHCCLPLYNGIYTHQHSLHSGLFVRDILREKWNKVENLVLYHHRPESQPTDTYLAKIITLADWLASGERRGKEDEEPTGNARKDPLISVFSRLNIDGKTVQESYCPLNSLQTNLNNLFPTEQKDAALKIYSYSKLWDEFIIEAKKINFNSFAIFYPQLLRLLEKYTLFVPSAAYKDMPDLSLFHHLKSTAAIAVCLYDLQYPESKIDELKKNMENCDEDICYLVGGDISGIQDFIYAVTSENALRGLRGRSLYLQLICDAVARNILQAFQLPESNIIYIGGGHFYLLIPAVSNAQSTLNQIENNINKVLLSAHQGKLAFSIGAVSVNIQGFQRKYFGKHWAELGLMLAKKKKQRFAGLSDNPDFVKELFEGSPIEGKENACKICGEDNQSDEPQQHCPLCHSFMDLAHKSREHYLSVFPSNKNNDTIKDYTKWYEILSALGWEYHFADSPDAYNINSLDFLEPKVRKGYYLMARHIPLNPDGNALNLEDIAKEARGIKKWGVLRADVDHLGIIFKTGLGEDNTISRISMLSNLFGLFFTLQIEAIAKLPEYNKKVYIIYSGGDDLCILGAWSVLPELAMKINDDFNRFTCHLPTISAGIYIAPSDKYPVYQATRFAGDALDISKSSDRNKIALFDYSLSGDAMAELKLLQEYLTALIVDKNVPQALLSILYFSAEERNLAKENKIPIQRIWRMLYALKRMAERYKKHEDIQNAILELRNYFISKNIFKPDTEIAVRWADYLSRKETK